MLALLFIFALGSVLCGVATSLNFLIAGRSNELLISNRVTIKTYIDPDI